MRERNHCFHEGDLRATLEGNLRRAEEYVKELPKDQFLNSSVETLVGHVVEKFRAEPLILYRDNAEMEQAETEVDVHNDPNRAARYLGHRASAPGVLVTVTIPFSGEATLWKLQPSSYTSVLPYGDVRASRDGGGGELKVQYELPHDRNPDELKKELDRNLDIVGKYIGWQHPQIESYNQDLERRARSGIEARQERLGTQSGISDTLGIPLKRRDGEPNFTPIRAERRSVPRLPDRQAKGRPPEPGIADETYKEILRLMRHVGRSFERTPGTFARLDEEELRDVVLANLNSLFEGGATGETFRKRGKTDICIEEKDRAAFVAECKVWRGPKELAAAIDQLLGYLTWRDCKCALVVFNKHVAGFSTLLEKLPRTIREHPSFRKELDITEGGEWSFMLVHPEDDAREIRVHAFLFDLFLEEGAE